MSSNISNIDEFGRDLSLKPKEYKPINFDFLDRYKGMSWIEIEWLLEEEEEEEKKRAERSELLKTHDERKKLYHQGLYELEEGEELDM